MSNKIVNFPTTKGQAKKAAQKAEVEKAVSTIKGFQGKTVMLRRSEIRAFDAILEQAAEMEQAYKDLMAEKSEIVKEVLERNKLPVTTLLVPVPGQPGSFLARSPEEVQEMAQQIAAAQAEAPEAVPEAAPEDVAEVGPGPEGAPV